MPLAGRPLAAALAALATLAAPPGPARQAGTPATPGPAAGPDVQARPDLVVTGRKPASTCSGKATAPIDYACLNGALKTAARGAPPVPSAADAAASQATTPSKAGTFSHTATAQRMGRTFGHSAQPYRPPVPAYANPVRTAPPQ